VAEVDSEKKERRFGIFYYIVATTAVVYWIVLAYRATHAGAVLWFIAAFSIGIANLSVWLGLQFGKRAFPRK